jgi:hypothetical protein
MKRSPEEKLLDPMPGGILASVAEYGIDLSLIAENMRLSPEHRVRRLQQAINSLEKLRAEVAKSKLTNQ